MAKPLLSFRPKPEVAKAAKAIAAAERRPLGQWLANLVEDGIAQRQPVASEQRSAA